MKRILFLSVLFMIAISLTKAQTYNVSTYTGSTAGFANGDISVARFRSPERVIYDNDSNLIVVDRGNHTIRKITPSGVVSTIAGAESNVTGSAAYVDANGTAARFSSPWGVAVDATGNIYVTDRDNRRIRKIATNGDVTTHAGSGTNTATDNDDPILASFMQPLDVIIDLNGNLIIADGTAHKIRKIATDGKVSTLAGTGVAGFKDDDDPLQAQFSSPSGLGIDGDGNIYVADRLNFRIRKIDAITNKVSTVAGSGTKGTADNDDPLQANLFEPYDVDVDAAGNIFVGDLHHVIRKIATTGKVTTVAGSGGATGNTDGAAADARFYNPSGLCVAANGTVYVADLTNNRIRKIVDESTMPVHLVSFTAKLQGTNNIVVSWQTASEQNNSHFELLKSDDGINWTLLKTIEGNGNKNQVINYSYTDVAPFNGTNYYVLKQVDYDGKSSLSEAISIDFNIQNKYPFSVNYSDGNIHVSAKEITTNGIYALRISNVNGQIITSKNVSLRKGENKLTIQSDLQPGIYVVSLYTADNQLYKKFVVE